MFAYDHRLDPPWPAPPAAALRPQLRFEIPLYTWRVDGDPKCRMGGVEFDDSLAMAKAANALETSDATTGTVRVCYLHPFRDGEYEYGRVIAEGKRENGTITWDERP